MHADKPEQLKDASGEFLTYLCYKSDAQAGAVQLDGPQQGCTIWVDGKIVFEDSSGNAPSTIAYSGDGFGSHDLKQALRAGMRVCQARLRIEMQENSWTCTLKAGTAEVAAMKLAMPAADNTDEQLLARMLCVERFNELLDALYGLFIEEVYGSSWKSSGYRQFQQWLRTTA